MIQASRLPPLERVSAAASLAKRESRVKRERTRRCDSPAAVFRPENPLGKV